MGDRANVKFISGHKDRVDPEIYFYTHWAGTELPETVREALIRGKGRWFDSQYLARIIFSTMIKENVLLETGYGISTVIGDGEDRIITVDTNKQMVILDGYGSRFEYSFEEFVALGEVSWEGLI